MRGIDQEFGITADMQGVVFTVHDLPCDTGSGAELFRRPVGIRARCRVDRAGGWTRRVSAYPERVRVPARAGGRAEVAGGNIGSDDLRGGTLQEQNIVRTCRLVQRIGHVDIAAFDRKLATEWFEAGVAEIGVFNSGKGAARKESDGSPADAGGTGETIGGPGEVVYQRIIPIPKEFADDANSRTAGIDAIIEPLRNGRRAIRAIVVTAGIEVQSAGDRNTILIVSRTDCGSIVRHRDDHV